MESSPVEIERFVLSINSFSSLSPNEKILAFIWFLHYRKNIAEVTTKDVRSCFSSAHLVPPHLSVYMPNLANLKPPRLIRRKNHYKLEANVRAQLTALYGVEQGHIRVTSLLSELPRRLPIVSERDFLQECLKCYQAGAFRAAIVMAWNLTMSHLIDWIMADPARLSAFNSSISKRYQRISLKISKRHDFEDLKDEQVVEICNTANLMSKNVVTVLLEKLKKRNIAAHPSNHRFTQLQADEIVIDLIENVVLQLENGNDTQNSILTFNPKSAI